MMAERRVILEILKGALPERRVILAKGQAVRIGRTDASEVILPEDRQLSGAHCSLLWDGERCVVRDLDSATGTELQGTRITQETEVPHGATLRIGNTFVVVLMEGATEKLVRPPSKEELPRIENAIHVLSSLSASTMAGAKPRRIFGLFDAGRSPRIFSILREGAAEYRSLYEGLSADTLVDVAPYLVELTDDKRLREQFLREGWGKSFGVYFLCTRSLAEVRSHFRRLTMAIDDTTGKQVYFRFYDPRVLAAFLPIATPRQRAEMFGEISVFLTEGADGEVLVFEPERKEPARYDITQATRSLS